MGNGPYIGDRRGRVVVEKGEGRVPLEDLGIDVRIVLKLIHSFITPTSAQ